MFEYLVAISMRPSDTFVDEVNAYNEKLFYFIFVFVDDPKLMPLGLCGNRYSMLCDLWLQTLSHQHFVFWHKLNV